ncbi:MAG: hypothetical protein F4Z40_08020 [Chloroflexi bacterium]|nr:hypothetical protein [Chloroflexota bacterium]
MGSEPQFANLTDVNLREAWRHEAQDFTPWLAQNLHRLSDVIGIELEAEGTEVAVDQFSADIVAQNPADGSRVLIENQLAESDHTHLGQILTYLAGVDAQVVIWVASGFSDAHRSAIRWLNDHSVDPFAFFAVRLRVVQIANSPLAPILEVLEQPSAWDRTLRARVANSESELTRFRRRFWAFYAQKYPEDGVPLEYAVSNFWTPLGPDVVLSTYVSASRVGAFLRGKRGESSDAAEERIKPWLEQLDAELGAVGTWTKHDTGDSRDQDNWPEMADWIHNAITSYRCILESPPNAAGR